MNTLFYKNMEQSVQFNVKATMANRMIARVIEISKNH